MTKKKYEELKKWLDENVKWRIRVWERKKWGTYTLTMQLFTSDATSAYFIAEILSRVFPKQTRIEYGDKVKEWGFSVEIEPVDIGEVVE